MSSGSERIPSSESFNPQSSFTDELKKVHYARFCWKSSSFQNSLKKDSIGSLSKNLEGFFSEILNEQDPEKVLATVERLAELIPLEKLKEKNLSSLLKMAKIRLEEARLYLNTETKRSPTLNHRLSDILEGMVSTIESIIGAFGIGDFFQPSETSIQADFKSQKILMLLQLFLMLSTLLIPALGATEAAAVIGGVLFAIIALSLVFPHIKPVTSHLPPNAENWTKELRQKKLISQTRKESLDEIANILKMGRHAILTGPSRVGKSLTAKSFAQAVERGDYPELKGMKVFRINTADLIDRKASFLGGGNNILKTISEEMGRHRGKIILVFDEIHMACKAKGAIAEQFKLFLDEGGEFPHVIGITTDKEYDEYVKKNQAFANRFDEVKIQNTDKDETLAVLSNILLHSSSKPLLDDSSVLSYIYEQSQGESKDAPQPATSTHLLKKCINHVEKTQKSEEEKKIAKIAKQIRSLQAQTAASRGKGEIFEQIKDLENKLQELESEVLKKKEHREKLFRLKKLLDSTTIMMYRTLVKTAALSPHSRGLEKKLALFLLLHDHLTPALEKILKERSVELGTTLFIDQNLVDLAKNS